MLSLNMTNSSRNAEKICHCSCHLYEWAKRRSIVPEHSHSTWAEIIRFCLELAFNFASILLFFHANGVIDNKMVQYAPSIYCLFRCSHLCFCIQLESTDHTHSNDRQNQTMNSMLSSVLPFSFCYAAR